MAAGGIPGTGSGQQSLVFGTFVSLGAVASLGYGTTQVFELCRIQVLASTAGQHSVALCAAYIGYGSIFCRASHLLLSSGARQEAMLLEMGISPVRVCGA